MDLANIPIDKFIAAMTALVTWAQDAKDPDSDGGVGVTVNEALDLAKAQVSALGFNVTIYNKPEE